MLWPRFRDGCCTNSTHPFSADTTTLCFVCDFKIAQTARCRTAAVGRRWMSRSSTDKFAACRSRILRIDSSPGTNPGAWNAPAEPQAAAFRPPCPASRPYSRAQAQRSRCNLRNPACEPRPRRAYRAHRRRGRVAEGGGLLNRYRVVKPYRGFESLRLRQFCEACRVSAL